MERVPVCLVGCGGMGHRHIFGFEALDRSGLRNLDLVAVCDVREDNALRAADAAERALGRRPRVHLDIGDAVADPGVAAFDIVTEASSHLAVAVPALEAGKHVLCEKPLALTVRSCRRMLDAAEAGGAVLATAENLRRDPPNRLARAVLDGGLLGDVHLMLHNVVGGDDRIIITPWRHMKDKGAIGLDMGVHYTDILQYYLGEFDSVYGRGLIAEPVRRRRPAPELALESYRARFAEMPEEVTPTGEDSVIALYRMRSGVTAQLSYVPSGRGRRYFQRTVHGRAGSMTAPGDRTGGPVELSLSGGEVRGDDVAGLLPEFALDPVTETLFGGVVYDLPFADIDAGHLAIELHDFATAIHDGRAPEVDGQLGMTAVAAVLAAYESDRAGRAVTMDEILAGTVTAYQDDIDAVLGLLPTA